MSFFIVSNSVVNSPCVKLTSTPQFASCVQVSSLCFPLLPGQRVECGFKYLFLLQDMESKEEQGHGFNCR